MTDYSEHGAIPVDDAVVDDPPTVNEVIAEHDRRYGSSRSKEQVLQDQAIANDTGHIEPPSGTSGPATPTADAGADEIDDRLHGRTIGFLTANEGVEEVELTSPWEHLRHAGGSPVHIAPKAGDVQAFDHLDKAHVFEASLAAADAAVGDFDALVLPGGVANPDQLRLDDSSIRLVRSFVESGKPVAVICHGPWSMIEAGVVDGRRMTSWPSLATDLRNAGAEWVDEQVVVCTDGPNTIISSRKPDDLPAFNAALVDALLVTDPN